MSDRVTPTEIAARLGMSKPALVRYLGHESTRAYFGASGHPPTYPLESLSRFEHLRDLHVAGVSSPLKLSKMLAVGASLFDLSHSEISHSEIAQSSRPVVSCESLAQITPLSINEDSYSVLLEIRDALVSLANRGYPSTSLPIEERILTLPEAAEWLRCPLSGVSRRVKPFERGKDALSDLQAYVLAKRGNRGAE